jgi:hypothetical protein
MRLRTFLATEGGLLRGSVCKEGKEAAPGRVAGKPHGRGRGAARNVRRIVPAAASSGQGLRPAAEVKHLCVRLAAAAAAARPAAAAARRRRRRRRGALELLLLAVAREQALEAAQVRVGGGDLLERDGGVRHVVVHAGLKRALRDGAAHGQEQLLLRLLSGGSGAAGGPAGVSAQVASRRGAAAALCPVLEMPPLWRARDPAPRDARRRAGSAGRGRRAQRPGGDARALRARAALAPRARARARLHLLQEVGRQLDQQALVGVGGLCELGHHAARDLDRRDDALRPARARAATGLWMR